MPCTTCKIEADDDGLADALVQVPASLLSGSEFQFLDLEKHPHARGNVNAQISHRRTDACGGGRNARDRWKHQAMVRVAMW